MSLQISSIYIVWRNKSSMLLSSSSQQLASLLHIFTELFGLSASEFYWELGLAVLVTGPLKGPSAQQPHEGRHGGWKWQVCLCSTCWPASTDACDTDFGKGRDKRKKRRWQGMLGKKSIVMLWNVISEPCSVKINQGFLWDADCEKGFLFIHKPQAKNTFPGNP